VASVSADGAEVAQMKGDGHAVRVLIPPGRNARLSRRPSENTMYGVVKLTRRLAQSGDEHRSAQLPSAPLPA